VQILHEFIRVADEKNAPAAGGCPGYFCNKRKGEILLDNFCPWPVIKSGPRMGDAQYGKEGGLLDFIISIEICFNTGKYFLADGVEKLGIILGRIENNRGIGNKVLLFGSVIREIGLDTEGYNLRDASQTAAERNVGRLHIHRANKNLLPAGKYL
jgi:hypothetical protein